MITPDETTATLPPVAQVRANGHEDHDAQAASAADNTGYNVRSSWMFAGDKMAEAIAHCSPEARDALKWAFTWCIDPAHPVHFDEFCERVGYQKNTVWKIYRGKYLHPKTNAKMDAPARLVAEIRNFRREAMSEAKAARGGFAKTETADRVFKACDLALESKTPVFMEGASHIGKTEALKQYQLSKRDATVVMVELLPIGGVAGAVQALARAVGIPGEGNMLDLVARIIKAITPQHLIIIDELHVLANSSTPEGFLKAVETFRRIHDFSKCAMVLSFTNIGLAEIEKNRKSALEQLFRRGVHRIDLGDAPSTKDVSAVLKLWGLVLPPKNEQVLVKFSTGAELTVSPWDILRDLAMKFGLKSICERIRYAATLAEDDGEELTIEHFAKAHLMIVKSSTKPKTGWGEEGRK